MGNAKESPSVIGMDRRQRNSLATAQACNSQTKRNERRGQIIQHVEDVKTKNATEKKPKLMGPKKIPYKSFLLQNNLIKTRIQIRQKPR